MHFFMPDHISSLAPKSTAGRAAARRAEIRRQLWEYDQVLNVQRDKVYAERRRALLARDLSPLMLEYAQRTVDDILEARCPNPNILQGGVNVYPDVDDSLEALGPRAFLLHDRVGLE